MEMNDENCLNHKPINAKSKRPGLLSKIKSSKLKEQNHQHEHVLEHCRELLQIVFAKSTSADLVMKRLNTNFETTSSGGTGRGGPATLTFAMRHRCLRVASILVPQEALEEVLQEDVFPPNAVTVSLKACTFGAFIAKELEEMFLPIPHSDLFQLSQMHSPSYARALWRHHRDNKGTKGRLLLLILELYLQEFISDYGFLGTLIKEIETLRLPRTMLLALECIVRYMDKIGLRNVRKLLEATAQDLTRILNKLVQFIHLDLKHIIDSTSCNEDCNTVDDYPHSLTETLARLGKIISVLSEVMGEKEILAEFCTRLLDYVGNVANCPSEQRRFAEILHQTIYEIDSEQTQSELMSRLCDIFPTCKSLQRINIEIPSASENDGMALFLPTSEPPKSNGSHGV